MADAIALVCLHGGRIGYVRDCLGLAENLDGRCPSLSRSSSIGTEPVLLTCIFFGVDDGIRTHDPQDHNLVL